MRFPYQRRSGRIARTVPLILQWFSSDGRQYEEELVETVMLSRFGCSARCRLRPTAGRKIRVWHPALRKDATARIVYRELSGGDDTAMIAMEFLNEADFWEIAFPPA
jgi:hypothetical protein